MGREDAAAMSDTSSGRRGGRGRRRVEVGTQRRTQDGDRRSGFSRRPERAFAERVRERGERWAQAALVWSIIWGAAASATK